MIYEQTVKRERSFVMKKENWLVIIAGVLVGVAALVLTKL